MELYTASNLAGNLLLKFQPICERIEIVGSVRRLKLDCHDIEFLMIVKPGHPVPEFGKPQIYKTHLEKLLADLEYQEVLRHSIDRKDGDKYKKRAIVGVDTINEFCLDLFIVTHETWGVQSVIRTGPSDFSRWMVTPRRNGGALPSNMVISEGRVRDENKNQIPAPEEKDFFKICGLPYIEPKNRIANWKWR